MLSTNKNKTMSKLCIIPARGGSQRIPRKNVRDFLGKPILIYGIKAALECRLFDEVMVSTDDEEISDIALKNGASVPFLRSAQNAGDYATLADVLIEVIQQYASHGKTFNHIACILPTSPLVRSTRIVEAYHKLISEKLDSVCPVVTFSYPIQRALEFSADNTLQLIWPEYVRTRSQDLKPAYHDAGSFYWVRTDALLREKTLFCKKGSAIVLSELEVQDIDTESDWTLAEMKYKKNQTL
jgi:N-acylneuraminate cytidylyltransferase